jgi:hypothetical protein
MAMGKAEGTQRILDYSIYVCNKSPDCGPISSRQVRELDPILNKEVFNYGKMYYYPLDELNTWYQQQSNACPAADAACKEDYDSFALTYQAIEQRVLIVAAPAESCMKGGDMSTTCVTAYASFDRMVDVWASAWLSKGSLAQNGNSVEFSFFSTNEFKTRTTWDGPPTAPFKFSSLIPQFTSNNFYMYKTLVAALESSRGKTSAEQRVLYEHAFRDNMWKLTVNSWKDYFSPTVKRGRSLQAEQPDYNKPTDGIGAQQWVEAQDKAGHVYGYETMNRNYL